eukprot:187424-Pelagomonas_calceolata.AAC.3
MGAHSPGLISPPNGPQLHLRNNFQSCVCATSNQYANMLHFKKKEREMREASESITCGRQGSI